MKRIRKAVIPAAGYGTRFLPMTKAIPKEMLPIVDKPVIQYVVEEALQSGIEEILIISGHGKRAIEDHFDTNMDLELLLKQKGKTKLLSMVQHISEINVHYIRQKHMRGLGERQILCAKSFVDDEPFAVLLGDDVVYNESQPALRQLLGVYAKVGATVLGCQKVRERASIVLWNYRRRTDRLSRFIKGGRYGRKAAGRSGAELRCGIRTMYFHS